MASRATDKSSSSVGGREESCKLLYFSICFLFTGLNRIMSSEQHEEKKKLDQLRKELEEERQLQELQRLQEEATGKKRVDKLDWMYASPATADGGSMGGAKLGEKQMEDYLLGKKRVDEVLKQAEENVSLLSLLDSSYPRLIVIDPFLRLERHQLNSKRSRTPTQLSTSPPKSEKILSWRSRNKNRWLTRP
jgi:hypothetical protein